MAITVTTHWATGPYPWGWVRRYELRDDATGRLYSGEGIWQTAPTEVMINARAAVIIAEIEREAAEALIPVITDRTRLDASEQLLVRSLIEINLLSNHVASLSITAANKAGIQLRLAVVKATVVDALLEARRS